MIDAPASRRSSGWSAFTVALVPTGMNWGVSTTPWDSSRRPARARVEPSAGGGTSTLNRAAPLTSVAVQEGEDEGHDHRHEEHRPERDEDRHVLAADDDVAGQMTEERDPWTRDDDDPRHGDHDAEHDQRPAEALQGDRAQPAAGSPASGASPGASQRLGISDSDRRGGGIS